MGFGRLVRHLATTHWGTRHKFSSATLDTIEQAIARIERAHRGEIRFAIETALTPLAIFNGVTPRARALEVFAHLKVWDTEHNNGVLIYVELADRVVEIVADRGLARRVDQAEWDAVCRMMEAHFREGRFKEGSIAGIDAIGALLARHFPANVAGSACGENQLPDRPTLL
ncbi:MAG TPA: TPM domain-containing protein [Steroidobacteraceae bacterium]|nr:TPM domain-containing protein [Steroidobacteraceae bacterium]